MGGRDEGAGSIGKARHSIDCPIRCDAVEECRGKRIPGADRVSDVHPKSRLLQVVTAEEHRAAASTERDTRGAPLVA